MTNSHTDIPLNALAIALDLPLDHAGLEMLCQGAQVMEAEKGQKLFSSGDSCEHFLILLEGQARVQISAHTGREMMLFRVEAGQICTMATSCLMTESPYYSEGIAEMASRIILIPAANFRNALQLFPKLAVKLLDNSAQRIAQLTGIIDRLISRDLGEELKTFLLEKSDPQNEVVLSHQKIADELGSVREVISRKLKVMENNGQIHLSRGKITLLNVGA